MISGPLIRLIGLAGVIGLNALSFLVSVLSLVAVRHREPRPEPRPRPRGWIRRDIMEGLKFVARHPGLQPIFACSTVYSLTLSMVEVSLVLYCLRVLDLSTTMIGIVTGAAVLGYPIGNLLVVPLRRWIGPYRALVLAAVVSVAGILLMPAFGSLGGRVGVLGLVAGSSLHCVGEGAFSPMSLTVRQLESPPDILTRVASVQRFLVWGGVALGSLLAAGSTAAWGLSVTVWVGAVGTVLCLPALFRMRVRQEFWHPAAD
jgi:predicted MFS family arabinose efflux permease